MDSSFYWKPKYTPAQLKLLDEAYLIVTQRWELWDKGLITKEK